MSSHPGFPGSILYPLSSALLLDQEVCAVRWFTPKIPSRTSYLGPSILFPEGWDALSGGQELGKPPGWTVGPLQGDWGPSFWFVGFRPTLLARIHCCCTVHTAILFLLLCK